MKFQFGLYVIIIIIKTVILSYANGVIALSLTNSYKLQLQIDAIQHIIEFNIDMEYNYVHISSQLINSDEFSLIYKYSLNKDIEIISDSFRFINGEDNYGKINGFEFYYNVTNYNIDSNFIGLSHEINNTKYLLVYYLYNQQLINTLKYALGKNKIIFGNVPLNSQLYIGECNVQQHSMNWSCELSYIKINTKIITNNYPSIFQGNDKRIFIPPKLYSDFINNIFMPFYMNGECLPGIDYGDPGLTCDCNRITHFPKISFHFENVSLSFHKDDLFEKKNNLCIFNIERNYYNKEYWIFGNMIYQKYLTVFDYELNKIHFYNESSTNINNNSLNKNNNNKIILNIIYLNNCIIFLGIIYIYLFINKLFM